VAGSARRGQRGGCRRTARDDEDGGRHHASPVAVMAVRCAAGFLIAIGRTCRWADHRLRLGEGRFLRERHQYLRRRLFRHRGVMLQGPGERAWQPAGREPARAQFREEIAGGRPAGRVLGQAAPGQGAEFLGHPRDIRLAVDHAVEQGRRGASPERPLTTGGVCEDRPEAEHVARRAYLIALDLFRRHEPGRSHDHPRLGQHGGLDRLGDPEVDHSWPIGRDQHIRGLQVPVDHARRVNGPQSLRQACRQCQHRRDGQWPLLLDRLREGRPGDISGGQPGYRPRGIRVDHQGGEQPADIPGGGYLPREPGAKVRILGQFRPYDLDCH
jgi:hypothetical protein